MPLAEIKLQPNPNVVLTMLDEKIAVLLHLRTKQYYTLNGTGIRIWKLLQAGKCSDEIAARLQSEYRVKPEQASRSVSTFFESLKQEGLVQQTASTS